MKSYSIVFTGEGFEDVRSLPKNVGNFLKKEILARLRKDRISTSLPLSQPLEIYRSRHIGEYRVLFYFAEDLGAIAIASVGRHSEDTQKNVYKKLEALTAKGQLAEKILTTLREFARRST